MHAYVTSPVFLLPPTRSYHQRIPKDAKGMYMYIARASPGHINGVLPDLEQALTLKAALTFQSSL